MSVFLVRPPLWGRLLLLSIFLSVLGAEARSQPASSPPAGGTGDSIRLADAVAQTLATYPTLEAARRSVDAAAVRVRQAQTGYWPRVSAVGTYQRQDPVPEVTVPGGAAAPGTGESQSIGIQPNNLYDGRLQLRQTLYDFGQTASRVDRAEAGRATAERRVAVERSELAFQAIEAFYAALLARSRIGVQRDQVAQLERTLAVVRRQQEAGTATEFEVQSTRTRLSGAQSQLTLFRSQRRREAAELRRLLGTRPGAPRARRLSGTIDPVLTPADSSRIDADSLVQQALRRHPSVRLAQGEVEAQRRQVRVADRTDNPTLSLDAQGGLRNGYPDDLDEIRLNETIGVSLTVPLFQGFSTRRQVEEAQVEVEVARARLAGVQRRVQAQVEQAASDLRARLGRLATTQLRVQQAQRAAELARTRYEAGTVTNLELLEAETALQQARLERTEVRYQVVLGRFALQRAAGTLLPLDASSL